MIVRAECKSPPSEFYLKDWLVQLVDKLDMKVLAGPISGCVRDMPGNNGPTAAVIIETSHMACHVWTDDDPALIQLDVYTCGKLDKEVVLRHLESFQPVKVETLVFDREYTLQQL